VTSALIGASSVAQLEDNVARSIGSSSPTTSSPRSTGYATDGAINIWAASSES
jgi:hypothetical protein